MRIMSHVFIAIALFLVLSCQTDQYNEQSLWYEQAAEK